MKSDHIGCRLKKGDSLENFRVLDAADIDILNSRYVALEHLKTGARYIHIANEDRENTFAVAFKTVPRDSTGVAHILEHTVLCGSERFPVRDPFFSMLKRSLNTFMNAFTASDWTLYPFSTQNPKDFYNLMAVYVDAAFFPRIDPLSFKQEGHRLELETDESGNERLVFKGVVYNEMKGAMSSPDQIMGRSLLRELYPDTTYHYNSGGEPEAIPTLTHEQLLAFHRRHYHPSNAFFYSYGNLPLESHLAFLEERVLSQFDRIDPGTEVSPQPRWSAPREVTETYPLDEAQITDRKCQYCVAWLLSDVRDSFEVLVLAILEQVLLANSASPLRKALIDSQLGSSLSDGTGFEADNRDTLFACGLKDVAAVAGPAVWNIIHGVLTDLAQNGIDPTLVASAIHQIEFHRKEVTNTPYPYGIKMLLSMSAGWFHGGDPLRNMRIDEDMARIREAVEKGPFLEGRIRHYFLENSHRLHFTLKPDTRKMEEALRAETERLSRIREALLPSDLDAIRRDADALKGLQEADEDVSVLPTLSLSDIPPEVEKVLPSVTPSDAPIWGYDRPTAGIVYFTAAFGAGGVEKTLLPLVPFFCYAVTRTGTRTQDYVELARLMDLYTGGIGVGASARTRHDANGLACPFITLSGKCLERNQDRMFSLLGSILREFSFQDVTRLKNLLMEYLAGLESMVVQNGHRLAISLASRSFTVTSALSEAWGGVRQLAAMKAIARGLAPEDLERLAAQLSEIGQRVFSKDNVRMAVIADEKRLAAGLDTVAGLHRGLEGHEDGWSGVNFSPEPDLPYDGWRTATAVSFVAASFQAVRMDHPDAPALSVIGKLLRSLFLHREIREKGGAYGGFALYNPEDGIFSFASYRDPHIVNTLEVFDRAGAFLRSGAFSEEDVKEGILQVCSEIDRPDPPGPAAKKAFYRQIVGLTDEKREAFKRHLLSLTHQAVVEAATRHFPENGKARAVAVISGENQLQAANERLARRPLKLFTI